MYRFGHLLTSIEWHSDMPGVEAQKLGIVVVYSNYPIACIY